MSVQLKHISSNQFLKHVVIAICEFDVLSPMHGEIGELQFVQQVYDHDGKQAVKLLGSFPSVMVNIRVLVSFLGVGSELMYFWNKAVMKKVSTFGLQA